MSVFNSELTDLFFDNFDLDYVVHFPDGVYRGVIDEGAIFINMSTGASVADQPANDYWLRFYTTETITTNTTIQDGQNQLKQSVVVVTVEAYWPVSQSRKKLDTEIETKLDEIFLNKKFKGTSGFEYFNQQDFPKNVSNVIRASNGDVFNSKLIFYPFNVRHY